MEILDFYLRVETSVGTLRLPSVREKLSAGELELGFNWIVFEQPVVILSVQPFVELCEGCGPAIIDAIALSEKTSYDPGDEDLLPEWEMPEMEICYFEEKIPVGVIPNLETLFLAYNQTT